MLENAQSCAVLHITATPDSIITVSYNGIIVYELNNDSGWYEITDNNVIHYLCNITQLGEYVVQATLEGVTRTEKVVIEDTKNYFVSVKILFIYSSLNTNFRNFTTQNESNQYFDYFSNYVDCYWVGTNNRGGWFRSTQLTINTINKEYKNLCADIEDTNTYPSNDYRQRMLVTLTNQWPSSGKNNMSSDNQQARLVLNDSRSRGVIALDISNLSGTYYFGLCGCLECKLYNLYLA